MSHDFYLGLAIGLSFMFVFDAIYRWERKKLLNAMNRAIEAMDTFTGAMEKWQNESVQGIDILRETLHKANLFKTAAEFDAHLAALPKWKRPEL